MLSAVGVFSGRACRGEAALGTGFVLAVTHAGVPAGQLQQSPPSGCKYDRGAIYDPCDTPSGQRGGWTRRAIRHAGTCALPRAASGNSYESEDLVKLVTTLVASSDEAYKLHGVVPLLEVSPFVENATRSVSAMTWGRRGK